MPPRHQGAGCGLTAMPVHLIYARARNNVIGHHGTMPWHLPEDLAHFKRTTLGQPVVMGRVTWESIPAAFRPLPGRRNVVVSRQSDYAAEGAEVVNSVQAALALFPANQLVWVMGGAQIYAQALPLASQVVVTEIHAEFEGDAFAPALGTDWHEVSRTSHTSAQGMGYSLVTLERQP